MENKEIRNNDFLGNLIRQTPLESPSDDFVERIMSAIQTEAVPATERMSFFQYLNSFLPYAALILFCLLIFATSDIPFLNSLNGNGFFTHEIMPYLSNLMSSIFSSFHSRYISWGLMVGAATGFIFLVDRYFSRRSAV